MVVDLCCLTGRFVASGVASTALGFSCLGFRALGFRVQGMLAVYRPNFL